MFRKQVVLTFFYMLSGFILVIDSVEASTIETLTFRQMIERSAFVVEGKVIDLQVVSKGRAIRSQEFKAHAAPELSERGPLKPGSPVTAGEGGQMLFTDVTLAVERIRKIGAALTEPADTITFRIAGGVKDGLRVSVHGLPTFEAGKKYIVFLRPDFRSTAMPIVGIHQGYFRVLAHPQTGEERLLDFQGNLALGIENDRLAVRRPRPDELGSTFESKTHRAMPHLVEAPTSDDGSTIALSLSPKVVRYWLSDEAPLSTDAFFLQVDSRIQEGK